MNSLIDTTPIVDPSHRVHSGPVGGASLEGGPAGARKSPLGNNTKLSAHPENKGLQLTRQKYVLRAQAQTVLGRVHRVSSCQKVPSYSVQQGERERGISKNEDGKAFFHGVGACGDVHVCPVCSYKISENRRQEVIAALRAHREQGGIALLTTFTFPHTRNDCLDNNMVLFRKARSRILTTKTFRALKEKFGLVGYIRRLEITYGDANGWHPHDHEIWFLERGSISNEDLEEIANTMSRLWGDCCEKVGLPRPCPLRGFDLRFNGGGQDAVGSYLTKWGYELTYGHTKQTRGDRRLTPFGILAKLDELGYDPYYYKLFRDYAKAFKGRAQLLWSRGLKARFKLDDIADSELSERPEPIFHCDMTKDQHTAISLLGMFAEVLEYAEKNTPQQTIEYMDMLIELKERNNNELMFMAIRNDLNFKRYRKYLSSIVESELKGRRASVPSGARSH